MMSCLVFFSYDYKIGYGYAGFSVDCPMDSPTDSPQDKVNSRTSYQSEALLFCFSQSLFSYKLMP